MAPFAFAKRPGIPRCLGVLPQGGAQSGAGLFLRLEECQRKETRKQAIEAAFLDRNGLHGIPGGYHEKKDRKKDENDIDIDFYRLK